MLTSKALTSFFEENILNDFDFFLFYKDKQLLKEEKYKEFAEEQLKKARGILNTVFFAVLYGLFYMSTGLIEYGVSGEIFDLVLALIAFVFMVTGIFFATKKYYIIKSSMTLFLKLISEDD